MIYFAAASDGRIKIGTTHRDVSKRLSEIGQDFAAPLVLLGSVEGDYRFERAIHAHLREHCIAGEWFRDCDAVRRSVRNLILGGAAAIGFDILPPSKKVKPGRDRPRNGGPDLGLFARGARLVFGADAAEELAYIGEVDIEVAETWLDGKTVPPRAVRYALVAVIASSAICPAVARNDRRAA